MRGDIALVDDGVTAGTFKLVVASHEVVGADVQCAGHNTAHIHLRVSGEEHTVGVDQEHLAVGVERALDDRHVRPQHPVERHGVAARLHKVDGVTLADAEALPVCRHTIAGLGDGQGIALCGYAGRAAHDLPAGGQLGLHRCAREQGHAEQQAAGLCAFFAAFAPPPDALGHGHKGLQGIAPDEAIGVVQAGLHSGSPQRLRICACCTVGREDPASLPILAVLNVFNELG